MSSFVAVCLIMVLSIICASWRLVSFMCCHRCLGLLLVLLSKGYRLSGCLPE